MMTLSLSTTREVLNGFLSDALQLHARDMVEADPEPRRSPRCGARVHRTGWRLPTRLLVWLRQIRRLRDLRGARQCFDGWRRACYHGRRRPGLGRDNGADDCGRDARGTREGQGHRLPPPRRVASFHSYGYCLSLVSERNALEYFAFLIHPSAWKACSRKLALWPHASVPNP